MDETVANKELVKLLWNVVNGSGYYTSVLQGEQVVCHTLTAST